MDREALHTGRIRVADLLRHLRKKIGLRQVDVAERLGEPQSFVSKYESAERSLELAELAAICDALGVSLRDLIRLLESNE